ncbi:hypothetical protein B1B_17265 [mine drainage metagenome]|uniref:Uncharacterized protein n=1 Tax=mine drainage metagenome TaxID=410659 RepID=T0YR76_9ZZZZ
MLKAKKGNGIRLKDIDEMPTATAKRYLDRAVEAGLLKHEGSVYMLTDRYTRPLRNIATYIKTWMESQYDEDISTEFALADTGKQKKRGGRISGNEMEQQSNI